MEFIAFLLLLFVGAVVITGLYFFIKILSFFIKWIIIILGLVFMFAMIPISLVVLGLLLGYNLAS